MRGELASSRHRHWLAAVRELATRGKTSTMLLASVFQSHDGQVETAGVSRLTIGIDPTVDFAFKKLLGSPEHSRITIHFLNAVLGGSPRISEVTILNPFLVKDFEQDKLSVLDVLALDEHGQQLNIEMQTSLPAGMNQRLTYYTSSLYVAQLTEGQDYPALRPAINICVLEALMFPRLPELHLDFRLRERIHGATLTDDLQIHTIELPKYTRPDKNDQIVDGIEKWAYFLRFAPTSTVAEIVATLGDEEFIETAGVLEMIAKTPSERSAYDARLKFQRDEAARLLQAQLEGKLEGRLEGRLEGEQIGKIRVLQQLLGVGESPTVDLENMDLTSLEALAADLQSQLEERG